MTYPILAHHFCCVACGEVHGNAQDARDCCNIKLAVGFHCGKCHTFHEKREDAANCCGGI